MGTAVVTGARGVGYEVGRGLAGAGYRVIFGVRNLSLGEKAATAIRSENPAADVIAECLHERLQCPRGLPLTQCGRKAFATQAGQQAWFPGAQLCQQLVGCGAACQAGGKHLKKAMDYIAEGAHGERAFRALEVRRLTQGGGGEIRQALLRGFGEALQGIERQRQTMNERRSADLRSPRSDCWNNSF